MDATETSLAVAAILIMILMGCMIGFFLYTALQQHRQQAALQQQFALEQASLVEDERRRISHDLHDQVGQLLWVVLMQLEAEEARRPSENLRRAKGHLEKALTLLETTTVQLLPLSDLEKGLHVALEELFAASRRLFLQQEFTLTCRLHREVPVSKGLHLYRIIQEVLWNAVKHARCSRLEVVLNERRGWLYLQCRDNGEGFDLDEALRRNRVGLRSLQRRTEVLGGSMRCKTGKGEGTTYFFAFPV